jgi:prepilin-type N-terminal cleavage/methylation domain-containing protein
MNRTKSQRAFTLVEVLVVIAIIAVLVGIVLTATRGERGSANERVCTSNLHQIGLALVMYREDYEGKNPEVGSGLTYSQAGLPASGWQFDGFSSGYIKDRRILFCPSYHGTWPISQMARTYQWSPSEEEHHSRPYRFSTVSADRGMRTPIATCVEHNPRFEGREPRWETRKVILLRQDLSVSTRVVPIRSRWPTF